MAKLRKVDPDLIGSTGFQTALQLAIGRRLTREFPQRLKMSRRRLSNRLIGRAATQPVTSVANKLRGYRLVVDLAGDKG